MLMAVREQSVHSLGIVKETGRRLFVRRCLDTVTYITADRNDRVGLDSDNDIAMARESVMSRCKIKVDPILLTPFANNIA